MILKNKFYIVVDNTNSIWERADDWASSHDYFNSEMSTLNKKNLMSLKQATKFKDELDNEISKGNYITFFVKSVDLTINL